MFTGLVEGIGRVSDLAVTGESARLVLEVGFAGELGLGDSLAVNGCCLTVAEGGAREVAFDLLGQTLRVTGLGDLTAGSVVNLERALAVGARRGGHFVQGHVDATGEILALGPVGQDYRFEVSVPREFLRYLIPKGSIAIDGMSLTAAEVDDVKATVTAWITPHTFAVTNLAVAEVGRRVNLEFDLLAKYLERFEGRLWER
jgi:riboflavin synthase